LPASISSGCLTAMRVSESSWPNHCERYGNGSKASIGSSNVRAYSLSLGCLLGTRRQPRRWCGSIFMSRTGSDGSLNPTEGSRALRSAECLLLAQGGHHDGAEPCPLLGVKRTSPGHLSMSAFDCRLNRSMQHKH